MKIINFESTKLYKKIRTGIIKPDFFLKWRNQMLTPGTTVYNIYTLSVIARAFQITGDYFSCLQYSLKAISINSLPHIAIQIYLFIKTSIIKLGGKS